MGIRALRAYPPVLFVRAGLPLSLSLGGGVGLGALGPCGSRLRGLVLGLVGGLCLFGLGSCPYAFLRWIMMVSMHVCLLLS